MRRFQGAMLTGYYLLVVTFPLIVFGQNTRLPTQIVPCNGIDCKCSHLVELAQRIINTGIFIFVFFAALMFAYAGFLYVTNEALGEKDKARKIFSNVTLGLIVILAAWLVVDTLMKALLGGNFGPWNEIGGVDGACAALGIK